MKKPVAFIIFNRPDTTAIVFEEIRKYSPKQLFVIADGPRASKEGEAQLCADTRALIQVDWDCDVTYIYSDENQGCKKRISSGLDEVFSYVEDAIILEDDCLPHTDFFSFCEELLEYYREEEKVMTIAGNNFQLPSFQIDESYYFSVYPECWGWATWKRAWEKIDISLGKWSKYKESNEFDEIYYDVFVKEFWEKTFDDVATGLIDSWAYPWVFTSFINKGYTILPKKNLVSNIGFSKEATHTKEYNDLLAELPVYPIDYPLIHPKKIVSNFEADFFTTENIFNVKLLKEKASTTVLKMKFIENSVEVMSPNNFEVGELYIFGSGEWGEFLQGYMDERGYRVKNFLVMESKNVGKVLNGIKIKDIRDIRFKAEDIILVSIEGHHDRKVISLINDLIPEGVKIINWKYLTYKEGI